MSEILLHLVLGALRFFIGLYELFGFLFEADFYLANGLFSSKALLAARDRLRRRRVVSTLAGTAEDRPLPIASPDTK